MIVRIMFTGRSYQTSAQLPSELDLPEGSHVTFLLEKLGAGLPDDQSLPGTCLVAVSGRHIGTIDKHETRELQDGDEVLLIAPVAGG